MIPKFCVGTHDIQNLAITSNNGVFISLDFVFGANALGALIIVYSLTDDTDVHYSVIVRQDYHSARILTPLIGLSKRFYNFSAFVVTEQGLPFTRAATLPKIFSNTNELNLKGNHNNNYDDIMPLHNMYLNTTDTKCAEDAPFTDLLPMHFEQSNGS